MWWWIASRAEDEQYKGKNSILRRGVLVLGKLVWVRITQDEMPPTMVASPIIEALVLFPNIEREGIPQRLIRRGAASTSYPDKSNLRLPKALVVTPSWAPR